MNERPEPGTGAGGFSQSQQSRVNLQMGHVFMSVSEPLLSLVVLAHREVPASNISGT